MASRRANPHENHITRGLEIADRAEQNTHSSDDDRISEDDNHNNVRTLQLEGNSRVTRSRKNLHNSSFFTASQQRLYRLGLIRMIG